jgi:hypothetical protein
LTKALRALLKGGAPAFPRIFSLPEYLLLSENHARHDRLHRRPHARLPPGPDCTRTTIFLQRFIQSCFRDKTTPLVHFDGTFPLEGGWTPELSEIELREPLSLPPPSLGQAIL